MMIKQLTSFCSFLFLISLVVCNETAARRGRRQEPDDDDDLNARTTFSLNSSKHKETLKIGNTKTNNYNIHESHFLPTQLTQVVLNVPKIKKTRKLRPPTQEELAIKLKILEIFQKVKDEIQANDKLEPAALAHLEHLGRVLQSLNPKYIATERVSQVAFDDPFNPAIPSVQPTPSESASLAEAISKAAASEHNGGDGELDNEDISSPDTPPEELKVDEDEDEPKGGEEDDVDRLGHEYLMQLVKSDDSILDASQRSLKQTICSQQPDLCETHIIEPRASTQQPPPREINTRQPQQPLNYPRLAFPHRNTFQPNKAEVLRSRHQEKLVPKQVSAISGPTAGMLNTNSKSIFNPAALNDLKTRLAPRRTKIIDSPQQQLQQQQQQQVAGRPISGRQANYSPKSMRSGSNPRF